MLRRRWAGHRLRAAPRQLVRAARRRAVAAPRVARVAADPAPVATAAEPGGDPALRYWRWHGAPRVYYSDYAADALAALAKQVAAATPRGSEAWVVFDNTAHGHATPNAVAFQTLAVS